jgi:hypothetical protein
MKKKIKIVGIGVATILILINIGVAETQSSTREEANQGVVCSVQQPVVEWSNTFDRSGWDEGTAVRQTSDGGYIIVGDTSSPTPNYDVWLIKTYPDGTEQWNKPFGGDLWDWGSSVEQTSDGGYIIAGTTYSFPTGIGGPNVWVIKTDSNGNIGPPNTWEKTYGSGRDFGESVGQTSDGGYIVAGYTDLTGTDIDVYFIKTDASGNVGPPNTWQKTYGGTSGDSGWSVEQTSDGGYIIAGSTESFGIGNSDVYLIKTDANGDVGPPNTWQRTYGGGDADAGHFVQQTSDGGYIIAGYTRSFGAGGSNWGDIWLIKTDNQGNKQWDKTFGGTSDEFGRSVQQASDGGYIIAGHTESFGAGSMDAWVIKTDDNGNKMWDLTFGGPNTDSARSVQQTSDGGYIIAGQTCSAIGSSDVWLIKLAGYELEVEYQMGLHSTNIPVTIRNIGAGVATNINWEVDIVALSGLLLTGTHTTGTITIPAHTMQTIVTNNIFGLAFAEITTVANGVTNKAYALVVGPYIFVF